MFCMRFLVTSPWRTSSCPFRGNALHSTESSVRSRVPSGTNPTEKHFKGVWWTLIRFNYFVWIWSPQNGAHNERTKAHTSAKRCKRAHIWKVLFLKFRIAHHMACCVPLLAKFVRFARCLVQHLPSHASQSICGSTVTRLGCQEWPVVFIVPRHWKKVWTK